MWTFMRLPQRGKCGEALDSSPAPARLRSGILVPSPPPIFSALFCGHRWPSEPQPFILTECWRSYRTEQRIVVRSIRSMVRFLTSASSSLSQRPHHTLLPTAPLAFTFLSHQDCQTLIPPNVSLFRTCNNWSQASLSSQHSAWQPRPFFLQFLKHSLPAGSHCR